MNQDTSPLPHETPLRIALLAHNLHTAGGATVGRNVIASFTRMFPQHRFLFVVPAGADYERVCNSHSGSSLLLCNSRGILRRFVFDMYVLPRAIRAFHPDVVLALGNFGMSAPPCPQAVFVHQPHLVYPDKHYGPRTIRDRFRHRYLKSRFARQLENSALLFCQTEVMAKRLRSVYNFPGDIVVCGSSASPSGLPDSSCEADDTFESYRNRFKIVYVARYYPHKNIESLVDLSHRYPEELRDVVTFITIDPNQHPNAARILKRIVRLGLQDRVINLGALPHSTVATYLRRCDALIMPTFLETFGLPYVEAMKVGLPILTSDLDFAHEVCGDAALYFDPWNIESMKEEILRLKSDDGLRHRLSENAKQRAIQSFPSWDKIVGQMMEYLLLLPKNL